MAEKQDQPLGFNTRALHAGYQPDPASAKYPLALISPASEKSVSSTLAELRQRPAVLQMNPADARARGGTRHKTRDCA